MKFTAEQISLLREKLIEYRESEPLNGKFKAWKVVLNSILLCPAVSPMLSGRGDSDSDLKQEALRRFALGETILQADRLEAIRIFLDDRNILKPSEFRAAGPVLQKIHHIRDIIADRGAHIASAENIEIQCVIVARVKHSQRLFLDVQDETGTTQIVVEKEGADSSDWEDALLHRIGDTVAVNGTTSVKYKSATAVAHSVSAIQTYSSELNNTPETLGLGSPITRAYAARLQKHIREYLEEEGYVEISTRLITSAPPDVGVFPLRVLYEGYGTPFYITPSPIPQLIRTLSSTSYRAIFSISHCFALGYRDPVVSVESEIISIVVRNETLSSLLKRADEIVRALIRSPGTRSERELSLLEAPEIVEHENLEAAASKAVDHPEIQLFGQPNTSHVSRVGRLCWPTSPSAAADFREYVPAEGFSVGTDKMTAYSAVTINVDRLLSLLFEHADLRRIPSLKLHDLSTRREK